MLSKALPLTVVRGGLQLCLVPGLPRPAHLVTACAYEADTLAHGLTSGDITGGAR